MLSSISKIADKPFVIGFLLPSLIFVLVASALFPLPGWAQSIVNDLQRESTAFAGLTYLVLVIWLISTTLLLLNYDLYRLFEGYLPPMKWFTVCQSYHRWRHERLLKKADAARAEKLATSGPLRVALLSEYPLDPKFILPTAFGNVLRSFEQYSWDVYSADGVALWPRLVSVLPKEFVAQMDNDRSQVDFPVNLCVLSWVVAAIALGELVFRARQMQLWMDLWPLAADTVVALSVSWLLYRWATHALGGWGEAVKAAWDCYLPALAGQLGYVVPDDEVARKTFWRRISAHVVYRRDFPQDFNPFPPVQVVRSADRPSATAEEARQPDDELSEDQS